MKWSDLPMNPSSRVLRQFAGAWLVFFLGWAAWQGLRMGRTQLGLGLAILAVVVGVGGLIWPALVRWIFVGWMILAFPIGWLISHVLLAILYFGIFTPFATWFRLRGRDALRRRPCQCESYWQPKETPTDVRRYFLQY
jgi:hypothetical protein